MTTPRMRIAHLDESELSRLRTLEDELGIYVVALTPDYPLASLSDEQLQRLQTLERELGVVLLAHQHDTQATTH